MILVVKYTQEFNEYDHLGRLVVEKGTVLVSHGIDTDTDKVVILPCEKWSEFRQECFYYDGEWFIKESTSAIR